MKVWENDKCVCTHLKYFLTSLARNRLMHDIDSVRCFTLFALLAYLEREKINFGALLVQIGMLMDSTGTKKAAFCVVECCVTYEPNKLDITSIFSIVMG